MMTTNIDLFMNLQSPRKLFQCILPQTRQLMQLKSEFSARHQELKDAKG